MGVVSAGSVLAAGAGPQAGLQHIYLGIVAVFGILILVNARHLGRVVGIIGVFIIASTFIYLSPAQVQTVGAKGGQVLDWVISGF